MPSPIASRVAPEHRQRLATPLDAKQSGALITMLNTGLMRPVLEPGVANALIAAGYAKRTLGGVSLTDLGETRAMMESGQ